MLWMMMFLIWRGTVAGVFARMALPKAVPAAVLVKVSLAGFDPGMGKQTKPRAPP